MLRTIRRRYLQTIYGQVSLKFSSPKNQNISLYPSWCPNRKIHTIEMESYANLPLTDKRTIYCFGDILETVQCSDLFKDSKTFVDKRMRYDPIDVHKNFQVMKKKFPQPDKIPRDVLQKFLEDNFEDSEDLEHWVPEDWKPEPSILNRIYDPNLRQWAKDLNLLWKMLARRMNEDVKIHSDRYSLIYVPNGFIVPGGRFKELYYWDTFWILNGLLYCDMLKTAKGVLENMLHLVLTLGIVPNGNRVYYEKRTQPPMLISMMESYCRFTNDQKFLEDNIHILDKEMKFYRFNRGVEVYKEGVFYKLYRYYANQPPGPRPESYREDIGNAKLENTESQREARYCAIKSAAESGWDFSSRWFIFQQQNRGNLSNIESHNIIPVDLNALLHKSFVLLARWYQQFGNERKSKQYALLADELLIAIEKLLWSNEEGIWQDYDLLNHIPRNFYYSSNFTPLWTESFSMDRKYLTYKVIDYMNKFRLEKYVGGTPSSIEFSGEQWDFPNAWPPQQSFVIQGLYRLGTHEAKELALYFADQWIHNNYFTFNQIGVMYEKYDAIKIGTTGDGGEYGIQEGFGWTNGIVIEFLYQWGDKLRAYNTKHRSKEWVPVTLR